MSREALQTIVGLAITDKAFREDLLVCPLAAAQGFDLTDQELAALAGIRAKTFEQFAARLDLWLSKMPVRRGRRGVEPGRPGDALRVAG